MKRRTFTAQQNVKFFLAHGGLCNICGGKIDAVREKWEREHVIPLALGGEDDEANMRPAHVKCHRSKTDQDVSNIARAKRREARHMGAKPKSKWPSRPMGQRFTTKVKQLDEAYDD